MHDSHEITRYAHQRMLRFGLTVSDVTYVLENCGLDHTAPDVDSFVEHEAVLPDGSFVIVRVGSSAIFEVTKQGKGG